MSEIIAKPIGIYINPKIIEELYRELSLPPITPSMSLAEIQYNAGRASALSVLKSKLEKEGVALDV